MKKSILLEIVVSLLFGAFFSYFSHFDLFFSSDKFVHQNSYKTFLLTAIISSFVFLLIFEFIILRKTDKLKMEPLRKYLMRIFFIYIFLVDLLLIPLYNYSKELYEVSSKTLAETTGRAALSLNTYFFIGSLLLGVVVLSFLVIRKLRTIKQGAKLQDFVVVFNILFFLGMFLLSYVVSFILSLGYGIVYFSLYGA